MPMYPTYRVRKDSTFEYDVSIGWRRTPVDRSSPLPYSRFYYRSSGYKAYYNTPSAFLAAANRGLNGPAYAQAYDSFYRKAKGGAGASLGVTLYEWKSSLGMIAARGAALLESFRQLKRGNILGAARSLGINDPKTARGTSAKRAGRSISDQWLELNFGWAPLLEDIGKAVDVLQQSIPVGRIRATGSQALNYYWKSPNSYENWVEEAGGVKKILLSGEIKSVNPNLLLASQLGFTNPATVAWDVVPFSFVVDWFLPVNKFLKSFDAHLGIEISKISRTVTVRTSGSHTYVAGTRQEFSVNETLELSRTTGDIPLPSFVDRIKPLDGSLWRAITSMALVHQLMSKSSR